MKFKLLIISNIFLTSVVFGAEHVAKKGDTLSEVASQYISGKIYGAGGSLNQVLSLNPNIANPNIIYPGQVIVIGESSGAPVETSTEATFEAPTEASSEPMIEEGVSNEPVSTETTADLPYETTEPEAEVPQEEGLPQEGTEEFTTTSEDVPQETMGDSTSDSKGLFTSSYEAYLYAGSVEIEAEDKETGTKGSVPSASSYGVRLGWNQHWNEKLRTSLLFDFNKVSFEKPDNADLEKGDPTLMKFGVGGQYQLTSSLAIYEQLLYGSEVFYFAENSTTVRMDKGNALTNRTGLLYENVSFDPFKIYLFGGMSNIFPSTGLDYDSESGFGYHGGLGLGRALGSDKLIQAFVDYQSLNKNTTLMDQVEKNLRFYVGLKWGLQ